MYTYVDNKYPNKYGYVSCWQTTELLKQLLATRPGTVWCQPVLPSTDATNLDVNDVDVRGLRGKV